MSEMIITIGIVFLIIVVIALIISIFANITIGTPTPINVLVKPISKAIGNMNLFKNISKRNIKYENERIKSIKTYELNKEKIKENEFEKIKENEKNLQHEKTFAKEEELEKDLGKTRILKK